MKGSSSVIQALNDVLTIELTSINQYFLHARIYKNWGLTGLNDVCYKKSIKDMKQADKLIERVLFLEGLPNLQALGKLNIGEHTEEMLGCDKAFQQNQLTELRKAIALCETEQDYVSRELLEGILAYEEEHLDWLETQEQMMGDIGLPNFLQVYAADD